jgi:hypothetical protein
LIKEKSMSIIIYGGSQLIKSGYNQIITRPLRLLYFNGVFWRNSNAEDICAQITDVPSDHWKMNLINMKECAEILERRFSTWNTTVFIVIYFILLIILLAKFAGCCFNSNRRSNDEMIVMHAGEFQNIISMIVNERIKNN